MSTDSWLEWPLNRSSGPVFGYSRCCPSLLCLPRTSTGKSPWNPKSKMNEIDSTGFSNLKLDNHRTSRFHGASRCCGLTDFVSEDVSLLKKLYRKLSGLHEALSSEGPDEAGQAIEQQYGDQLRELKGAISRGAKDRYSASIRSVVHDVLGGSLTVLLWMLQDDLGDPDPRRTTKFLAGDHLKMMRNAIHGLDDAARALDQGGGLHGVPYLRDRWSAARLRNDSGAVEINFSSDTDIAFAEICFEFSTVQRVIYNMLSNACTHTANQRVDFDVSEITEGNDSNVRFIISNLVSEDLSRRLSDASSVFDTEFSTSGGGLGLSICADLVSEAYGLESAMTALSEQYVGVEIQGQRVVVWFHWPGLIEST